MRGKYGIPRKIKVGMSYYFLTNCYSESALSVPRQFWSCPPINQRCFWVEPDAGTAENNRMKHLLKAAPRNRDLFSNDVCSQSHTPPRARFSVMMATKADLESAIKVMFLIVGKMAEDRGLSKYQASFANIKCVLAQRWTQAVWTVCLKEATSQFYLDETNQEQPSTGGSRIVLLQPAARRGNTNICIYDERTNKMNANFENMSTRQAAEVVFFLRF